MKSDFSILDLVLVALVVLLSTCGASPTPSPDIAPTPVPTTMSTTPAEVERARDAALAYLRAHYAEQAPPAGLVWTGTDTTPPQLLGANHYRFTAGDWTIEMVVPVVAPENVVYDVVASDSASGFKWQGRVDRAGQVREQAPGAEAAREALTRFFALLSAGQYSEAASWYGGSYDILQGWNPEVAREDSAALFRAACTANGLQCLPVKEIVQEQQTAADEFQFVVEFARGDGSLFVRGPCCGATETEMPSQSQFTYTVRAVDGRYLVQELPVYIP